MVFSFSGVSVHNLKQNPDLTFEDSRGLWEVFADKSLSTCAEQLLNHVLKLLNILCYIIDETPLTPQNKHALGPGSALSPLKRRKSDLGEKPRESKEDKSDSAKTHLIGYFANSLHYVKIYDILRTAYTNYKVFTNSI